MSILSSAPANYGQRKIVDYIMRGLTIVATLIAIVPLVLIIGYVTVIGGGAMSIDFFTKTYEPPAMSDGGFSLPSNAVTLPTPDPAVPVDPNATPDPFAGIDLGGATGVTPVDGTQKGEALSAKAQGGVLHAIIGTLLITGAALLFSLPIGILAAVFLAEYPSNTIATVVRFCTDLLSGAPSIIVGVTAYILIVVPFR